MNSNGRRRPPRPQVEVVAPGAGPDEMAAIAAALEQFLHDTSPSPAARAGSMSPWMRAALAEGIGCEPPAPWGDHLSWGSH